MKKNTLLYICSATALAIPTISFAYVDGLKFLLSRDVPSILTSVWLIMITLAFLYFFWGVGQFILKAGETEERKEGKQKMLWGIIALFVIMSIFGILNFIGSAVGIPTNNKGSVPCPPACTTG